MRTAEKLSARAARTELQAWYLEHLRPRLEDAVAVGNVEQGAMVALDFQLAGFFPPPEDVRQGVGAAAPRA
jgi:hypothetical protein